MNKYFKEYLYYISNEKIIRGLFTIIAMWLIIEVAKVEMTKWLESELGISGTILTGFGLIAVVLVAGYISFYLDRKKRDKFIANPTSKDLKDIEKYKGLIVSISNILDPKEVILEKINAIKDVNDQENLENAYNIRGIGQTFRAIVHHLGKLERCWLLCTPQVKDSEYLVNQFIQKLCCNTVHVYEVEITDSYKIESTFKKIKTIYTDNLKEYNLSEKDVIADLTGGTAIMSCAMMLACLSPYRDTEYLLQAGDKRKLIKIDENISGFFVQQ